MKKVSGFVFSVLFLLISVETIAQFILSAEVRPRSEFRNGFKNPTSKGYQAAFFIEQRSRLYADFKQEKYQMRVAFQDIRVWGQTTQIFKQEIGTSFISEAWGELKLAPKLALKAGRQIIAYDNQRFLGGLEWAQQGRRHDAALLKFEDLSNKTTLHLGVAYNSDNDVAEPALLQAKGANYYSVNGNYKTLQYAWFHKDFKAAKLSLLALNAGMQNTDTTVSNKQTFGFIAAKELGAITLATDSYYQTGKQNHKKVNAFLIGLSATLKTKLSPLTLGYEYISGKNDTDKSDKVRAFSPDYGTNHAFNGLMDYFYVGPSNGTVGLQDIYLKTQFKLGKGMLEAHAHEFFTGSIQLDKKSVDLKRNMGTEIDLVFTQQIGTDISFNLGFSQLFASETMLNLRSADLKSNNWAWAMITFKPTLFKTEK